MKNQLQSALELAKTTVKSIFLFNNTWKERTTMLLHGKREADKTAQALDIAVSLSRRGQKAVYVDTQRRLDDYHDKLAKADNLLVLRPEYEPSDDKTDYADLVISSIEEVIASTDIRIFIVDSVTRIAALSFGRNASAAYVMKRLVALQVRSGISLIVLAHDSTKSVDRALANLADCELEISSETQVVGGSGETVSEPHEQEPVEAVPLTRQQRRALERRQRKLLRSQHPVF